ncbi:MAG: hypothetical protein RXQ56_08235 [Thermoproteus sp.]
MSSLASTASAASSNAPATARSSEGNLAASTGCPLPSTLMTTSSSSMSSSLSVTRGNSTT